MFHIFDVRTMRAARGAALLTLIAGCSDVPSGLRQPLPGPSDQERPVSAVADRPLVEGTAISVQPGEHLTTRTLRRADGHQYQIDVARSADGLPREMSVKRDGVPVVRVVNDWRSVAGGYMMTRQRLIQFASTADPTVYDTRDRGGVSALIGSPITVAIRPRLARVVAGEGGIARGGRIRALEDVGGDPSSGPCDGAARTAESALEDWVLSVAAMAGATLTGNAYGAWMAYGYQLKKSRDMARADAALDDCVANAGKKNTDEL
jgi:hypothetical protein